MKCDNKVTIITFIEWDSILRNYYYFDYYILVGGLESTKMIF